MALSVRQKVFFFVGLCLAIFGFSLTILGAWGVFYWIHGASGASMWCGILLVMCGVWDIIIAIDQDPQQEVSGLSLSGLLVNMGAVFLGMAIIGFSTWGAWDFLEQGIIVGSGPTATEKQIELYVSHILLGSFTFILGLIALMADCCCGALFGPGIAAGPPPVGPYPGYPAPGNVNYGYPPQF